MAKQNKNKFSAPLVPDSGDPNVYIQSDGRKIFRRRPISPDETPSGRKKTRSDRLRDRRQKRWKNRTTRKEKASERRAVSRGRKATWLTFFYIMFIAAVFGAVGYKLTRLPPVIHTPSITETDAAAGTITIRAEAESRLLSGDQRSRVWLCVSQNSAKPDRDSAGWIEAVDGAVQFTVPSGAYYVFALDSFGQVTRYDAKRWNFVTDVSISPVSTTGYLPMGSSVQLQADVQYRGCPDRVIRWDTSDREIAVVEDGILYAVGVGTVTVTASAGGEKSAVKVTVSNLYTLPDPDSESKEVISEGLFTKEDEQVLDKILEAEIAEAGYGTRAGAVTAARFLALEFPYRIPYFYENGRLDTYGIVKRCDGEGRFYHKGLYLTEAKYSEIAYSISGPAYWGCPLKNWNNAWVVGKEYPNGLDCSGFITWALLNGGFDVGDIGAGDNARVTDLCDLGERISIRDAFLEDRMQVGDFLFTDGHVGMVIGLDAETVYVAESLQTGIRVLTFRRDPDEIFETTGYTYTDAILLDKLYGETGNISEMW